MTDADTETGQPTTVVVVDGTLTIGGQVIEFPCPVKELEQLFGERSRDFFTAGLVHTWDEHGVYANMTIPDIEHYSEISFALDRWDAQYWPHSLFDGSVTIDGQPISRTTLVRDLEKDQLEQYGGVLWYKACGNVGVFFSTNDKNVRSISFSLAEP